MEGEKFEQGDKNKNAEKSGKSEETLKLEVLRYRERQGELSREEKAQLKQLEERERERNAEEDEAVAEEGKRKAEVYKSGEKKEDVNPEEDEAVAEEGKRKEESEESEETPENNKSGESEETPKEDEGVAGGDENEEETSVGAGGRITEMQEAEMEILKLKKKHDESFSELDNIRLDELENKSWYNLEETRKKYIEQYQEFLRKGRLARVRDTLGIPLSEKQEMSSEFTKAKEKYDQAKQEYIKDKWKTSIENLSSDLSEEQKKEERAKINNEAVNTFTGEYEKIRQAKKETFWASEKATLSKAYQRWTNLSKTNKFICSTAIMGGAMGFGAAMGSASLPAASIGVGSYAGRRAVRVILGGGAAGGAGKAYDKIFEKKKKGIEATAKNKEKDVKEKFNINNLAEVEKNIQEAMKQKEKRSQGVLYGKIATMAATGIGVTFALGALDSSIAEAATGTAETADTDTGVEKHSVDKNIEKHSIKKDDNLWGTSGKEQTGAAETADTADAGTNAEEQAGAAETAETGTNEKNLELYSVEKGDNLWDTLKNEIPQIEELKGSGMKDNVTDNLIEKIKEEGPEKYGIESDEVGNLKIGDDLKMEKIQELLENEKIDGKGLIEHAKGLSEDQLEEIRNYEPPESSGAAEAAEAPTEGPEKGTEVAEPSKGVEPEELSKGMESEALSKGVVEPEELSTKGAEVENVPPSLSKEIKQNVTDNLKDKMGGGSERFMYQEWPVLKDMPAEEALKDIEGFKEKDFFGNFEKADELSPENAPFSDWLEEKFGGESILLEKQDDAVEFFDRRQLKTYLKQAYEKIGGANSDETMEDYLQRFERVNLTKVEYT